MSGLDFAVLALILIPAVVGAVWGLWATLCRLAGLILCVPVALVAGPRLEPHLLRIAAEWRPLAAQVLVGLAVLVLGSILGWAGTKLLKAVALHWINRLLGALVGVAAGAFLGLGLVLGSYALHAQGVLRDAPRGIVAEAVRDVAPAKAPLLPSPGKA